MTEPFFVPPDFKRCIYEYNTLQGVTAEIRFPIFLKLINEAPADFQAKVVSDYPMSESMQSTDIGIDLSSAVQPTISKSQSYRFTSLDLNWVVEVTGQSLSLTSHDYIRWEDFAERLNSVVSKFLDCYGESASTIQRLGLRYVNIIDKLALGLSDKKWSDLIEAPAGGFLVNPSLPMESITNMLNVIELAFGNKKVRLRQSLLRDTTNPENKALSIDADYYQDTELAFSEEQITDSMHHLHALSGPMFRWFITDALHKHLKPMEA